MKVPYSGAGAKAAGAQPNQSSSSAASSSGGGNAKYLRYVRSKLSKSRLNSVLSLSGASNTKESAGATISRPYQRLDSLDQLQQQQQQQQQRDLEAQVNGSRQQLATSGAAPPAEGPDSERQHLQRQQFLSGSSEVELLARRSERLRLDNRKLPIGQSMSNELGGKQPTEPQPAGGAECLPPAGGGGSRPLLTQQFSIKKSNFFQGFRYTLKGRRGSKQAQQQPQPQPQPDGPGEHQDGNQSLLSQSAFASIQQSTSLTSISGSQPLGRLNALSASKKFRHKLLHQASPSAAAEAAPSAGPSPDTASASSTPQSASSSSPFFGLPAGRFVGGRQSISALSSSTTTSRQHQRLLCDSTSGSTTTTSSSTASRASSSIVQLETSGRLSGDQQWAG